jgi:hypothetical protein
MPSSEAARTGSELGHYGVSIGGEFHRSWGERPASSRFQTDSMARPAGVVSSTRGLCGAVPRRHRRLGPAQPLAMKGDQYRKFLKDNEQSAKKLMGW